MTKLKFIIGLFFLALLTGCAPLATFSLSNEVDMEVHSVSATDSELSVKVKFVNKTGFPEIVQEGHAEDGIVFVEKFAAGSRSYTDHHFGSELTAPKIERTFKVYAGLTTDTDETFLGFAMLPANKDGSVVTLIPKNFNSRYQESHVLRGRVVGQSTVSGEWHIIWWPGKVVVLTPTGKLVFEDGESHIER